MTERKSVIGEIFNKEAKAMLTEEPVLVNGHFYEGMKEEEKKQVEQKQEVEYCDPVLKKHDNLVCGTYVVFVTIAMAFIAFGLEGYYGFNKLPFKIPTPGTKGDLCVTITLPIVDYPGLQSYSECSNGDKISNDVVLRNATLYRMDKMGISTVIGELTGELLLGPAHESYKDWIFMHIPVLWSSSVADYVASIGKENLISITSAPRIDVVEGKANHSLYTFTYRDKFYSTTADEMFKAEFAFFGQSSFGIDKNELYYTPVPFLTDTLEERVETCLAWNDTRFLPICRRLLECQSTLQVKDAPFCSCVLITTIALREQRETICGPCTDETPSNCECQIKAFMLAYGIKQHRCIDIGTVATEVDLIWRDRNTNFVKPHKVKVFNHKGRTSLYESLNAYIKEKISP